MAHAVNANAGQPQTGQNGSLPESQYNIHCIAIPGPDYKLNYYTASCAERQSAGTCISDECKYFKSAEVPARHNKHSISIVSSRTKMIKCVSCGKMSENHGRQLCKTCHTKNSRAGTLSNYPLKNTTKPRKCIDCGKKSFIAGKDRCRKCYNVYYRERKKGATEAVK